MPHLADKGLLVLRVSRGTLVVPKALRVPLDPREKQVRRGLKVSRVFQELPAPQVLMV